MATAILLLSGCHGTTSLSVDHTATGSLYHEADLSQVDTYVRTTLENLPASIEVTLDPMGQTAQALSMAGRTDLVDYERPICSVLPNSGEAIDYILSASSTADVVFLNEAHDAPEHRRFLTSLLGGLAHFGYQQLAMEALANFPGSVVPQFNQTASAFVPQSLGSYLNEPTFSSAIVEARKLGFHFVAYETNASSDTGDAFAQMLAREHDQFANLRQALEVAKDAKLIVYNGYGHAIEKPMEMNGQQVEFLAGLVKRETDIDPLTVDQTTCWVEGDSPKIVLPPDETLVGAFDIFVGHPAPSFIRSRPSWMFKNNAGFVAIDPSLSPLTGWTIIESRLEGAPLDTVPFDRVGIRAGETGVAIFVPDDPYVLSYFRLP